MRFTRQERYERFEWTARKLQSAIAKPERQARKVAERYPLLADVLPVPVPFDQETETLRRRAAMESSEARMRSLHARVWRESRRDFFRADAHQQDVIRNAWKAWRGPTTAFYFRYIVDEHTGVMEARSQTFRARHSEARMRINLARSAQADLCLL